MTKVTISDIARESGVSKTTISRYLNGNYSYMSLETRAHIAQIIEKYHYVPNNVARSLKSKKSKLIGVITHTLRNQVGAQTVTEINEVCTHSGYSTIIHCTNDDPQKENEAIQACLNAQVDGLIIIPCTEDVARYVAICDRGIPVVLCTRKIDGWPYACVYANHEEMIRDMMRHLKDEGFEKVRFFVDSDSFYKRGMKNIFAGYAQSLFDMTGEDSIATVRDDSSLVAEEVQRFRNDYLGEKKAIFAINTPTLFLLLKYFEDAGISAPEELGICGYDVIGWSELVAPGITAIRQPMNKIGRSAALKMMECLNDNTLGSGYLPLDGQIYFRDSTKLKK